jgi:hypothetical protein
LTALDNFENPAAWHRYLRVSAGGKAIFGFKY